MHGEDWTELGVDWGNVGRTAFGVVHKAGGVVLNVFGQKALAQQLEAVEAKAGLLPDWARSTPVATTGAPATTVTAPEYVVFVRPSNPKGDVLQNVSTVSVTGGTRFAGNGYRPGEGIGRRFSFGVDAPFRIDFTMKTGEKGTVTDATRVLFLGGAESESVGEDLCGFYGMTDDDLVGWSTTDTILSIFNPAYLIYKAAGGKTPGEKEPAGMAPSGPPQDYTKTAAHQQAQARLAAAQASLAAAQAKAATAPTSYTITPVSIPSFKLEESPMSADYVFGTELLGAVPAIRKPPPGPRPGKVQIGPPPFKPVKVVSSKGRAAKRASPHKEALQRGKVVLARAEHEAALAKTRAEQYKKKDAKAGATTVVGYELLGAVAAAKKKPLTPAQRAAVKKNVAAVAKHRAAAQRTEKAAARAKSVAAALKQEVVKAKPVVDKLFKKSTAGVVMGRETTHEVLGDEDNWTSIVGESFWHEIVGAPTDPDPLNPGFLIDGSVDPAYSSEFSSAMAAEDGTYTPAGDAEAAGLIPMPTRNVPLSKDDAVVMWTDPVPEDGIRYQGDKGFPSGSVGSWSLMYDKPWINESPNSGSGYIWHANPGEQPTWWRIGGHPPGTNPGHGNKGSEQKLATAEIASFSRNLGFGPLVGNPNGPLAGLQWSVPDQQWFWQAEHAPSWAAYIPDRKIKDLNDKTLAANKAAADARAAVLAQDQAAAAEAQAKQDAENALALSAADTQAQVAQQAAAAQQTQLDIMQQKLDQQYAGQLAALEMKAKQAELDYAIANPPPAPSYEPLYLPSYGFSSRDESPMWEEGGADAGAPEDAYGGFSPEEMALTEDEWAAMMMDEWE